MVHAPVTEDEAQQIAEDLKSGMSFLLFGAACFQEVPYLVIREEFLQRSGDFALFIFADLCYACHGNSLLVDECLVALTLYHF